MSPGNPIWRNALSTFNRIERRRRPGYEESLIGTLGVDPMRCQDLATTATHPWRVGSAGDLTLAARGEDFSASKLAD